jgi:hypothetical protein
MDVVGAPGGALSRCSTRFDRRWPVVAAITLRIPCDAPGRPRWFDLLASSRADADGRCIGATVTLSLSKANRKPIDRPDGASTEVQYPDRPRLAMEGPKPGCMRYFGPTQF